ncbi:hypothetical protein [Candidatus Pelagibacter sp.]|uniref:hypothetical protein n=1 Tax=Candidatus Pelagibacter sp. TaxID=2024849 RepID=UPI003F86D0A8
MLDNCKNCGSRTPIDQKDYRRMRTRKLNAILISKMEKHLNKLNDFSKRYPNTKIDFHEPTLWDDIKFKIDLYRGLIKHKLDLY